jgi:hypothetical protein
VARAVRQRRPSARPKAKPNSNDVSKKLTERKLAWIAAGGPVAHANAMAIVSFFESHLNDQVVNSIGATGAWQIYPGNESAKTLRGNAKQAVAKFKAAKALPGGTGYEPWKSSEGGWGPIIDKRTGKVDGLIANRLGLRFDKTTAQEIATGPVGDALAKGANALKPMVALGELAIGLTELLLTPEGWRRVLKVGLGSVILLWALNQLSKSIFDVNPVGRTVRTAAGVTGAGKVGSAVAAKTAAATGGKVAGRISG